MSAAFADLVLAVHFAFVAFVVGGLFLIWLGAAAGWRWIRDFRFRAAHLAAISFVALESLAGLACPLTIWEDSLRGAGGDTGFISRWLHRILFYSFPEWVFTLAYILFALAVVATYALVPPASRQRG
jgi:hypothetical protein